MSASNKKKLRKEQSTAQMTERQRKEAKEQKKIKAYTLTFWIVLALCVCIVLTTVLSTPVVTLLTRNTDAVTVGNHTLSATELNYFYVDAVSEWYNTYGSYAQYFGLDPSKALNKQFADEKSGLTWADSFLEMAVENIKSTYALYDMAVADGHKLTEEEQKALDSLISDLEANVKYYKELYESVGYAYNYKNAKQYLQGIYGKAATTETYKAYYEVCVTATSYYNAHSDSLDFNEEALRAYEADKMDQYNSFTFAQYYFKAEEFLEGGTKSEDGKKVTYSDEEKQAAVETAERLANELAAGNYETLLDFDKAINTLLTDYFASRNEKNENKEENKNDTTNGDAKTGDNTSGDETTGDETTGDDTTGDETTGDDTTGDDTTGDDTTGDDTTGDETTGDDTTGDETTGDDKEDGKDNGKENTKLDYSSTKHEDVLYSKLNALFVDWLIGKVAKDTDEEASKDEEKDEEEEDIRVVRKEGDLTVIVNESGSGDKKTINGYYVLRFGSLNDNTFSLKNVRHLLVAFEGGTQNSTTGEVTYSEKEKAAAKEQAEKLLSEFKKGDKSEESFTELLLEHSDDKDSAGKVNNEGLYEDIYPGQMVEAFENWCFDEDRKPGDYDLVETEYGWHIMFFVGDSETNYRDFMVETDLHNETMTEWMEDLIEKVTVTVLTDRYVEKDLILGS